jgi:hypothetical protein
MKDINKIAIGIMTIFLIGFVIADITITPISPIGNITTSNSSIVLNTNFSTDYLNNTVFNWDGTNYSLYDSSLVLFYNFDNRSSLGENDTHVADLSQYGNNGTVVGGSNISWTPNGKYGGAFNFSGNLSYISPNKILLNGSNSFTIIQWINPSSSLSSSEGYIIVSLGYSYLRIVNNKVIVNFYNGSDNTINFNTLIPNLNSWNFLVWTYNSTANIVYLNGITEIDSIPRNNLITSVGNTKIGIATNNVKIFNGTFDNIIIMNRSLSSSEISQIYYSSLTKYNSQNWTFYYNNSDMLNSIKINSTNPTYNYNYYLCSSNSTGNEVCSTQRTITNIIPTKSLTVNFTNSIGNIRDDFYGANTHIKWLSKPTIGTTRALIDINNDGTGETPANYTWQREKWLDAGMNNQRGDMYLSSYYTFINNVGFERWTNITSETVNSSKTCLIQYWNCGSYLARGNYTQTFSKSTDAHSGLYSLNVSENQTSSVAFVYRYLTLPANHTYNFTVWIKSSNVITWKAGWDDYVNGTACTKDSSSSGNWEQLNCGFYSNGTYQQIRIDANAGTNENFLIDDLQFYIDGKAQNYINILSLENVTDLIDWAYENNQKVYFIADRPTTIIPSYCYTSPTSTLTNPFYCNGTIDYDETYTPVVVDFLNQTTQNGLYSSTVLVEVSNEPYYYDGWYVNISDDNVSGALEYLDVFNSTIKAIKTAYPSIQVGGPSGFRNAPILTNTFLSNMSLMSYPADFHSIHPYGYGTTNGLEQYVDINNYINNCTYYGVDCSHMVASEWSVGNTIIKNTSSYSNQYEMSWVQSYISLLNSYPANVTSQIYQYSEMYSYINNSAYYYEYPSKWHMVLDPQFNSSDSGELTKGYNATKNVAHTQKVGNTVVNSTSDDACIKIVSSKSTNFYAVTIINTCPESKNITLDLNKEITTLINYETGQNYYSNSPFELGILDGYSILYLYYNASGEVLRLKFNENTGSTAYDVSGYGNNGTILGATWQNDGIILTLTDGVDYTLDKATGVLTSTGEHLYSYFMTTIVYDASNNNLAQFVGDSFIMVIPIAIILVIAGLAFTFFLTRKKNNYY